MVPAWWEIGPLGYRNLIIESGLTGHERCSEICLLRRPFDRPRATRWANTVSYTVPSAFFNPGIAPINFNFAPSLGSIDQFLSFSAGTLSSGEAGPTTVSITLLFSDQTTLAIVTPFDDIGSIPLNGILATSQFTAKTLVGLSVTTDNGPADLAIPAGTVITIDQVQSVPEPMSIATLGTGLVGLALARRRHRKV